MKMKRSEAAKTVRGHYYQYKGLAICPANGDIMHLWECRKCGHQSYRATLKDAPRLNEGGTICPFRWG